jgi:hypothetical protein
VRKRHVVPGGLRCGHRERVDVIVSEREDDVVRQRADVDEAKPHASAVLRRDLRRIELQRTATGANDDGRIERRARLLCAGLGAVQECHAECGGEEEPVPQHDNQAQDSSNMSGATATRRPTGARFTI